MSSSFYPFSQFTPNKTLSELCNALLEFLCINYQLFQTNAGKITLDDFRRMANSKPDTCKEANSEPDTCRVANSKPYTCREANSKPDTCKVANRKPDTCKVVNLIPDDPNLKANTK